MNATEQVTESSTTSPRTVGDLDAELRAIHVETDALEMQLPSGGRRRRLHALEQRREACALEMACLREDAERIAIEQRAAQLVELLAERDRLGAELREANEAYHKWKLTEKALHDRGLEAARAYALVDARVQANEAATERATRAAALSPGAVRSRAAVALRTVRFVHPKSTGDVRPRHAIRGGFHLDPSTPSHVVDAINLMLCSSAIPPAQRRAFERDLADAAEAGAQGYNNAAASQPPDAHLGPWGPTTSREEQLDALRAQDAAAYGIAREPVRLIRDSSIVPDGVDVEE